MPKIHDFCSSGCRQVPEEEIQDGKSILGPTYAFVRYCVKQYRFENKAEIEAAPRLKAYFFKRKTVNRIREQLVKADKEIVDWHRPWKAAGKAFVDSLPELG